MAGRNHVGGEEGNDDRTFLVGEVFLQACVWFLLTPWMPYVVMNHPNTMMGVADANFRKGLGDGCLNISELLYQQPLVWIAYACYRCQRGRKCLPHFFFVSPL